MHYWTECAGFLREFRRHFHTTGALLPSSRFLARALVSELDRPRKAARILEVGPGTGAVTRSLLHVLQPEDRLDIVEINAGFVQMLQQRFEQDPDFTCHRAQVQIIHAALEEVPGVGVYDYIVSGLPLNNFPVSLVRTIFRTYTRLLKPNGTLSYFEYVFIRNIKTPFVGMNERRRLGGVGRVVGRYIRQYQIRRDCILMNVPPAYVRHLRMTTPTTIIDQV